MGVDSESRPLTGSEASGSLIRIEEQKGEGGREIGEGGGWEGADVTRGRGGAEGR
jgi:hypothetical protein